MHDKEAKVWSENRRREYTQASSTRDAARDKIDKDTAIGKEHNTEVFGLIVFNYFMHTSNLVTSLWESEKFLFMFTAKIICVINRNKKKDLNETYADIVGKFINKMIFTQRPMRKILLIEMAGYGVCCVFPYSSP